MLLEFKIKAKQKDGVFKVVVPSGGTIVKNSFFVIFSGKDKKECIEKMIKFLEEDLLFFYNEEKTNINYLKIKKEFIKMVSSWKNSCSTQNSYIEVSVEFTEPDLFL